MKISYASGWRALGVTALTAAALATTATAAHAHADTAAVKQRFSVAVDNCRSGYTEGVLGWDSGTSVGQVVAVEGVVADQVNSPCGPGAGRYTEAVFRAFSRNTVVDSEKVRVDDAITPIKFNLIATPVIDMVEIQVCRRYRAETGPPLCVSETYPRPQNTQP